MKVTTQQLQAVLGNAQILRGIDFEANDGEFVGIIGPNGSGKSTLLRCIYRVLSPSSLFGWKGTFTLSCERICPENRSRCTAQLLQF